MPGPVTVVQFPHPGREHEPRGELMDWNRGEHRRKFLLATGQYLEPGALRRGAITFWGEWEAQSRVLETYPGGGQGRPRWLHEPWWELPRHRQLLQNTDPLVFGDAFLYSNCRQAATPRLRSLPPGSLVLFGSALRHRFVLDTVFVVADAGQDYLPGATVPDAYPDWVRALVFDRLHPRPDRSPETLRLYRGARFADDPSRPFSFVPTRPYVPSEPGFPRPALELDRRWLTPNLAMGAKVSLASRAEVVAVWQQVVDQVVAAGLQLAVSLEPPPARDPRGA
jgi:hypothetical protein